MSRWMVSLVAATCMALAGSAVAQEPGETPRVDYVMEVQTVDGTLVGPNGEVFGNLPPRPMPNLIRLRTTFVPEMVKTVDSL